MKIRELGEQCCGCGSCAAICPRDSIQMVSDPYGFELPKVDDDRCVGCGMCDEACPVINVVDMPKDECASAWWACSKDRELARSSSSGGVFGMLANDVLASGGIVCGAQMGDPALGVYHAIAENPGDIVKLQGSKYVQSRISAEVYGRVAEALRTGRRVLFSGCACQVAGMRGYLRAKRVDLGSFLGVEVICHGAPSSAVWKTWVGHVADRLGERVGRVCFRDKTTGWETYSVSYQGSSGATLSWASSEDWYMRAFIQNASLRPSCYACPFKRHCGSDIVLGDYWGISEVHPDVEREAGVSAVVVNTASGRASFEGISRLLNCGETDLSSISRGNPSLVVSSSPNRNAKQFMGAVAEGRPAEDLIRAWSFGPTALSRIKAAVRNLLGKG